MEKRKMEKREKEKKGKIIERGDSSCFLPSYGDRLNEAQQLWMEANITQFLRLVSRHENNL